MFNGVLTSQGQQTFQSWDTIDGGAGVNTLNVQNTGANTISASLANIQILNMQDSTAAGAAVGLNLLGLSSLTNLNLSGSAAASAFNVNSLGSLPSISLSNTGAATTINFTAGALANLGQTLNLSLNSVANAITLSDTGANALESIAITSSGSANTVNALTTTNIGATSLSIAGSENLTITVTDATTGGATLKTVNAANLTGNLTATVVIDSTVTGGSGNDTITSSGGSLNSFTGGAGNDTFVFGTNPLGLNTTVSGGDGILDTISAATASIVGFTTANPATKISGIESITLTSDTNANVITLANVQAGISDVNIASATAGQTGTIVFDAGVAGNIDVGRGNTGDPVVATLGAFTVSVAGSGITDSVTIDNDTVGSNIITGAITATGVETLTIDGTTTTTQIVQAINQNVTLTPSVFATPTTLNFIGNNSFGATGAGNPLGTLTATTVNATGLGVALDGTQAALFMGAGSTTTTAILGSAGNDTLLAATATATSIDGGAGNDTITAAGTAGDTLRGGDGNDTITGAAGNDSIDGGAGNDTIIVLTGDITANDTIDGGAGTADIIQYNTFVAATDNVVAAQQRLSNLEILRIDGITGGNQQALTMSNYINNPGFTAIRLGAQAATADGINLANASALLNTIGIVTASANIGTNTFDRLVDTTTDTLTVSNIVSGAGGAATMTVLTALDEETITLTASVPTTAGANDLTITTLTVQDLTTLNITTGASDAIITNIIGGATALATVNASTVTGAVTVNAGNSLVSVTMTANASSVAINTFTGGTVGDIIIGGAGADVLSGLAGADTISGGGGDDLIIGGTGSDVMTGGAGADDFTQGGQILATALNADTITDFSVATTDQIGAWSIANLETLDIPLTAAALDLVLAGNAATSIANTQAFVFATVNAAYDLGTAALASALVIDGNFSATTLATALEVGGSRALTAYGEFAAGDGFVVVYDDGANSYFALLSTNAIVEDDATFAAGNITIQNLVTLTGVSDATTILAANTIAFVA